jgi:hypothetical protein
MYYDIKMGNDNHRYSGLGTILRVYLNDVSVVCPQCNKEAHVTVDNPWLLNNAKLKCFNCMFSQSVEELARYNVILNRNCDNCGNNILITIPSQREKSNDIRVTCKKCGISRSFKPRNEVYYLKYNENINANDPVFGLPLWFQTDVRGNLFWALNREHLLEIKNYVGSKLRERKVKSYTTMVEKLPTFIRDAKNREAIIKAIERLQKKN